MKKNLCVYALMVLTAVSTFALNENVAVWERIYQETVDDEQRLAVVMKIMEFKDRDFAPILTKALDDLVSRRLEIGTASERYNKNQLAKLMVQELGNLKSLEAAELIFTLYQEVTEPFLKAEAAIALGKMRAISFAEQLSRDLASLNLRPEADKARNQEILALGLVQSLEAMRSPLGYEPVFLASVGWYSTLSRVKETARTALVTMVDDPTDSILVILNGNPSLDIKTAVLAAALASRAPDARKAQVASRALQIGVERATTDLASRTAAAKLRMDAMDGLIVLRDKTAANVRLLTDLIAMDRNNDSTLDETLKAYVALGWNGTDEAARYLAGKMGEYNTREKSKVNTPRDKIIIKQLIASMVQTGNVLVKNILTESQFVDHDTGIIREIKNALKTFG